MEGLGDEAQKKKTQELLDKVSKKAAEERKKLEALWKVRPSVCIGIFV